MNILTNFKIPNYDFLKGINILSINENKINQYDIIILKYDSLSKDEKQLINKLSTKENKLILIINKNKYNDLLNINKNLIDIIIGDKNYDNFLKFYLKKIISNIKKINEFKEEKHKSDFIIKQQKQEMIEQFFENKTLQQELLKKEKLSAIGLLTSTIVHDVKNSLGIVSGYSEIIEIKAPQFKNYTQKISKEIDQLIFMLQDILDFSKGKKDENYKYIIAKSDTVNNIIKNTYQKYKKKAKNINYNLNLTNQNYCIKIDKIRFERILSNIIKNSIEALYSTKNPNIEINTKLKNNIFEMEIIDNGKGIHEDKIKHIFTPFYTNGKKNGSGLGLAITKNIVTNMNGYIEVISKINSFTKFTLNFQLL